MVIIELHDTEFKGHKYVISDLVDLIIAKRFELIEQSNNAYVFSNSMIN